MKIDGKYKYKYRNKIDGKYKCKYKYRDKIDGKYKSKYVLGLGLVPTLGRCILEK